MTKIKISQLPKRREFKRTESKSKYDRYVTYTYNEGYLKPYFAVNNKPLQIIFPIKHITLIENPIKQTYELKISDKEDETYIYLNLQTYDPEDITIEYLEYAYKELLKD